MRKIQAPGVEYNEFDRSQYNLQNSLIENAPYCFVCGFSDKGDNYSIKYIGNKQTLLKEFGVPQTEYEKYFYNSCIEILQNGGVCLASRLPYDNNSLNQFTYCDYVIDQQLKNTGNILELDDYTKTFAGLKQQMFDMITTVYPFNKIKEDILSRYTLNTIKNIVQCLLYLKDIYNQQNSSNIDFNSITYVKDILIAIKKLNEIIADINEEEYCHLRLLDSNLTSYISISADQSQTGSGKISMKQFDDMKIGSLSTIKGKMRIVDISRTNYTKAFQPCVSSLIEDDCMSSIVETNDCLGIIPVLVTPANALYFQQQLNLIGEFSEYTGIQSYADGKTYNEICGLSTVNSTLMEGDNATLTVDLSFINDQSNLVIPLSSENPDQQSLSYIASMQFPNITFQNEDHLDPTYLKCIGLVVFKAYRDNANSGQVGFQLLESFIGSFDKNAKDSSGASIFIDKIVNSKSQYINVFTNVQPQIIQQASILTTKQNVVRSLGFYELDLTKDITLTNSINDALNKLFIKLGNPNQIPLDLIIDAGVSNIAQSIASKSAAYNKAQYVQDLKTQDDAKVWKLIVQKFDDFCKNTRRDCMFIADGLKTFCLINDQKRVRDTDPSSSVQDSILPKLKFMAGINSSYTAGYCNWFLTNDEYSGDTFWCPPSIKAVQSYIYCDIYGQPWSVPAGLNRGKIRDAIDVAFQPNIDDAGKIYSQTWNYAVSYPVDGIVLEGQKTFQKAYTALDRVNVRRLMLYLEKNVVQLSRHFLYEGNTEYIRQQFVDAITPIFDDAVANNGIIEYAIKCDSELNTSQVIDNNEMRCKIAVKPVKALEYIVLDFIVTNQTANVQEEVRR